LYNFNFQFVDIIIIFCYFIIIALLTWFTISYDNRIRITFLLLISFLIKIFLGFFLNNNAIMALQHQYLLSEYDATNYYIQSVYDVATQNSLLPELHWSVADPGFNYLLYWIGKIYTFCFEGLSLSYFHFIYLLIFFHTIIFLFIFIQLEKKHLLNKTVLVAFTAIFLFEPMMFRFSFSLEREIVVSFILLMFVVAFMDNNIWIMIFSSVLIVYFRDVYLYLIPTWIFSYVIFRKFFSARIFLFLFFILITFSFIIHVLSSYLEDFEYLFFHHAHELESSGFGIIIWSSIYFVRVLSYSLLGFVAPVPVYPFFNNEFLTFYLLAFIQGLSSISYLFFNSYIMYSLYQFDVIIKKKRLKIDNLYQTIYKAYIVIFISHLTFHGLIYNIRHRVQIIPGIIFVFLYILSLQHTNKELRSKMSMRKCFYISFMIVLSLNIFYIFLKILV